MTSTSTSSAELQSSSSYASLLVVVEPTEVRIRRVAQLNELATDLISHGGKDEMAIQSYKDALAILKDLMVELDDDAQEVDFDVKDDDDDDGDVDCECHHRGSPSVKIRSDHSFTGSGSVLSVSRPLRIFTQPFPSPLNADHVYIYKNLIRFRPCGVVKVDMNLLSATIIFNMAVFYHGRYCEEDASCCLGLQLYDMALILLEKVLSFASFLPGEDEGCEWECLFLRMVCFNNMAHAAYKNRDYDESRYLLDALMLAMRRDEDLLKVFLGEEGIHGIVMNCMLLHPPTVAEAA